MEYKAEKDGVLKCFMLLCLAHDTAKETGEYKDCRFHPVWNQSLRLRKMANSRALDRQIARLIKRDCYMIELLK